VSEWGIYFLERANDLHMSSGVGGSDREFLLGDQLLLSRPNGALRNGNGLTAPKNFTAGRDAVHLGTAKGGGVSHYSLS
jgi:hypothetical protein